MLARFARLSWGFSWRYVGSDWGCGIYVEGFAAVILLFCGDVCPLGCFFSAVRLGQVVFCVVCVKHRKNREQIRSDYPAAIKCCCSAFRVFPTWFAGAEVRARRTGVLRGLLSIPDMGAYSQPSKGKQRSPQSKRSPKKPSTWNVLSSATNLLEQVIAHKVEPAFSSQVERVGSWPRWLKGPKWPQSSIQTFKPTAKVPSSTCCENCIETSETIPQFFRNYSAFFLKKFRVLQKPFRAPQKLFPTLQKVLCVKFFRNYFAFFENYFALFRNYFALFRHFSPFFRNCSPFFRNYSPFFRNYSPLFRNCFACFRKYSQDSRSSILHPGYMNGAWGVRVGGCADLLTATVHA